MDADFHLLNENYGIPGQISFHLGPGNMVFAVINNRFGNALVTLAGAHIMSYRPHNGRETLWSSPGAAFDLSLSMRGGIPLCWPWFGGLLGEPLYPIHGFARTQIFTVCGVQDIEDGVTQLRLITGDSPATHLLWPHDFELEVSITLGQNLLVEWSARNPGTQPYQTTGALHPYFGVSNVHDLTLRGLEGTEFLDHNANNQRKTQQSAVTFSTGIDNIYLDTTADMAIEDPGFKRTIHLRKTGSHTSVVWNPGWDDAAIPDIGAGQHQFFVCVEAANAAGDVVRVAPGGEARLGMEIEIENWRET
ncbi:MAG: D-hexose-6-phosphate mutarotase [Anaerolineaceae bacterium]|nr:D-hexose-6-phosphate mutarotase [Anaerolineaceae bacterium]